MTAEMDDRPKGGIKGDTTRAARLAAELRRNLVRRKQRARAAAAANTDLPSPAACVDNLTALESGGGARKPTPGDDAAG